MRDLRAADGDRHPDRVPRDARAGARASTRRNGVSASARNVARGRDPGGRGRPGRALDRQHGRASSRTGEPRVRRPSRSPAPTRANLVGVFVDPEWRGDAGVTDALLGEIPRWVRHEQGLDELYLHVGDANARARRYYEKRGFRATGVVDAIPRAARRSARSRWCARSRLGSRRSWTRAPHSRRGRVRDVTPAVLDVLRARSSRPRRPSRMQRCSTSDRSSERDADGRRRPGVIRRRPGAHGER